MPKKPQITFVGHEASRTGAPTVLLHLLKHMDLKEFDVHVLLLREGPLREEFSKLYPTSLYDVPVSVPQKIQPLLRSIASLPFLSTINRKILCKRKYGQTQQEKPDLFYLHSHSYDFLHTAAALDVPVICHVCETDVSFRQLSPETLSLFCTYPSHYITVSENAKEYLHKEFGIPEDKISVVHAGVDVNAWSRPSLDATDALRQQLGIPADAIVVGGAGSINARKGTDVWLQSVMQIKKILKDRQVHFVWVGGFDPHFKIYGWLLQEDVRRCGLEDLVHFVGEVPKQKDYFALFDVLLFPSRQETFGIVMLENILLGIPVIASGAAGGPIDLAERGCIRLVPGLDAVAMAKATEELLEDTVQSEILVQKGKEVILEEYNIQNTAPQAEQIIRSVLEEIL